MSYTRAKGEKGGLSTKEARSPLYGLPNSNLTDEDNSLTAPKIEKAGVLQCNPFYDIAFLLILMIRNTEERVRELLNMGLYPVIVLGIPLVAVEVTTSAMTSFHSVTGDVYKTRERIHRPILASCNSHKIATLCPGHCSDSKLNVGSEIQGLRSLEYSVQHLTADNNHASPVSGFPKAPFSFKRIPGMSSPNKILRFASN
ncbi:hypothetical protein Cgig2_001770 [Carnegiea gigantea]|uniref:Uncharacterized protein n=1 Tax=Carnegiea gigantea TaxID=171969 RepID=A0A9Q1K9M4_9CARY|nr:hypothetical protein Cgig2_001770 [Carnegiea gigantea]